MVLLDTDFVVDLMKGHAGAARLMQSMVEGYEPAAVSSITVMQLHHGIGRSRRPEAEALRVEKALRGAATYTVTHDVAIKAGRLEAKLHSTGTPIGIADVIIAATALHHDEPLVTRNKRHFRRVDGLHVLDY